MSARAGTASSALVAPHRLRDARTKALPMITCAGTIATRRARIVARRSPRARAKRARNVTAKKKNDAAKSAEHTVRSAIVASPAYDAAIIARPSASPIASNNRGTYEPPRVSE